MAINIITKVDGKWYTPYTREDSGTIEFRDEDDNDHDDPSFFVKPITSRMAMRMSALTNGGGAGFLTDDNIQNFYKAAAFLISDVKNFSVDDKPIGKKTTPNVFSSMKRDGIPSSDLDHVPSNYVIAIVLTVIADSIGGLGDSEKKS